KDCKRYERGRERADNRAPKLQPQPRDFPEWQDGADAEVIPETMSYNEYVLRRGTGWAPNRVNIGPVGTASPPGTVRPQIQIRPPVVLRPVIVP
ncbi:MAG: hypothetical protein MN733_02620, partial [Nitrososphaera sp.]|nr:hypothetical protein [Nitrososphaera sp.]